MLLVLACFGFSSSNAQTSAPDGTEYIQDSVDFSFGSQNWDPPDSVEELTIADDARASVPLDFSFPLGQRLYTHSWMHSNGVVTFMSTFNWMCCNGLDLENYNYNGTAEPYFNHMIAPLWTDTINTNVDIDGDGVDDSGHYTESYEYDDGTKSQRYFWRNVAEYYNNNALNSFALEIYDTGQTDIWHFEIDIRNHDIFVGAVQDFQNDDDPVKGILFHDRSVDGTYTFTAEDADEAKIWSGTPFDIYPTECNTNPLYSAECPGYAEALFQQQCDANALYDSSCPGYATAYYNQQCSANPLYDSGCPGYQQAYYNQQCTADPLYDTGCPGYETAYHDQQCSLDPLYKDTCPGYEEAYIEQQCTYDPLYSVSCSGYAAAYAELQAKELEEESKKDDDVIDILDDTVVNDLVFDDIKIDDLIEIKPEDLMPEIPEIVVVEVVDETPPEPTLEETIEAEIAPPPPEPEPVEEEIVFDFSFNEEEEKEEEPVEEPVIEEEEVEDEKPETESSDNVDEQVDNEGDEKGDEPEEADTGKTESDSEGRNKPKQSPSQKRAKVKALLAQKAKDLANDLAKAQTLEEQQRIQNEIFAIQNFNYEFKGYSIGLGYDEAIIPDAPSPATGNRRGLLNGLAQQILHQQMVDMQWERK